MFPRMEVNFASFHHQPEVVLILLCQESLLVPRAVELSLLKIAIHLVGQQRTVLEGLEVLAVLMAAVIVIEVKVSALAEVVAAEVLVEHQGAAGIGAVGRIPKHRELDAQAGVCRLNTVYATLDLYLRMNHPVEHRKLRLFQFLLPSMFQQQWFPDPLDILVSSHYHNNHCHNNNNQVRP